MPLATIGYWIGGAMLVAGIVTMAQLGPIGFGAIAGGWVVILVSQQSEEAVKQRYLLEAMFRLQQLTRPPLGSSGPPAKPEIDGAP